MTYFVISMYRPSNILFIRNKSCFTPMIISSSSGWKWSFTELGWGCFKQRKTCDADQIECSKFLHEVYRYVLYRILWKALTHVSVFGDWIHLQHNGTKSGHMKHVSFIFKTEIQSCLNNRTVTYAPQNRYSESLGHSTYTLEPIATSRSGTTYWNFIWFCHTTTNPDRCQQNYKIAPATWTQHPRLNYNKLFIVYIF